MTDVRLNGRAASHVGCSFAYSVNVHARFAAKLVVGDWLLWCCHCAFAAVIKASTSLCQRAAAAVLKHLNSYVACTRKAVTHVAHALSH
eukprot:3351-Heterococcus_DN1.PRE.2